jgi:hypothetical protein
VKIGYAKLGRSMNFDVDKQGFQGDAESPNLLWRLARRNPDVTWAIVGRNNAGTDLPEPNVFNPWAERGAQDDGSKSTAGSPSFAEKMTAYIGTLDGIVIQVGQHGTSNSSIPQSKSTWAQYDTDPLTHGATSYDWAYTYAGFLIRGLNLLGDRSDGRTPVVWILPDPRNYIFARDIKWPTGMDDILSQYEYSRLQRHERFRDPRRPDELGFKHVESVDRDGEIWVVRHQHRHADLELMILPDDWQTWSMPRGYADRLPIGVATTSFAPLMGAAGCGGIGVGTDKMRRSELVRDFVLASYPHTRIYGKWDKKSLEDIPPGTVEVNDPKEFYTLLGSWRTTVALPALNTSWTVAKVYQAWATDTVCFMLRNLDDQGWMLPSRRPGAPELSSHPGLYSVRNDWTPDDIVLAQWLRVETPEELKTRVDSVNAGTSLYPWLVAAQRNLLTRRWNAHYLESEIERKLGIRPYDE